MNFFKKWYTYQKERFPVVMYGTYIMAVVVGTFCYTNWIEIQNSYNTGMAYYVVSYWKLIPMFIVAFLQFLMVRVIDEFKDYEDDCKYRPYRPVPRGLVTLKELRVLFVTCVILQLIITLCLNQLGILWLALMWIFFAIMSKNFIMKSFLEKHILIEVFLDEFLMPFLMLYLASFIVPINLVSMIYLLILGYVVSWIVEIARKMRSNEEEEEGVKTYTAVLGIKKATLLLSALEIVLAMMCYLILGSKYQYGILAILVVLCGMNLLFAFKQTKKLSKGVMLSANLYIIIAYFSLIIPLWNRLSFYGIL